MFITNDGGIQHSGSGIEGIHGGIDTQFGKRPGQHGLGVQMGESSSGSGIGKIIGRYVNGLNGSNGTLLSGGNTFLKGTQIGSEGRLITHSGGDTS